ncbi:hypothetical protein K0817_013010 [Microbacterium sp. HD4P20]|uniref:hypothetical protein n=1 Tax=Microbacterium sp. HD4P20 TaxID=2864874 RepID=UPI001C63F5A4|nr:hypothetical protein [Microbacterium sp. HD4P20]MCP2637476.1 hypothetical protein [Microbacterium sp. HD4P20]
MGGARQRGMLVAWRIALIAAFALGVTACASHPEAVPVPPPSQAVAAVDCSAEWDVGWGSVPGDFEPVAVYVCDPVLELAPRPDPPLELITPEQLAQTPPPAADPAPAPEQAEPRLLEGDLSPLLAAFAVPNDPKWPGPCTAIGVIVPDVWLVDADGRAIRPAYPVDGCNVPKPGVTEALDELTPID